MQKPQLLTFCDRLGHSRSDGGSNILRVHMMSAGVYGRRTEEMLLVGLIYFQITLKMVSVCQFLCPPVFFHHANVKALKTIQI